MNFQHIPDELRPVELAIPYRDEMRVLRLFLAGRIGDMTTDEVELCNEIYIKSEASKFE